MKIHNLKSAKSAFKKASIILASSSISQGAFAASNALEGGATWFEQTIRNPTVLASLASGALTICFMLWLFNVVNWKWLIYTLLGIGFMYSVPSIIDTVKGWGV